MKEVTTMNRINLCNILLNESETERQIISWDEDDHAMYSSACDDALMDGCKFETAEDAVSACGSLWMLPEWELQWCTYRVKPEFYDMWGAYDGCDTVTVDKAAELAVDWEKPLYTLFQQLDVCV